MHGSWSIKSSLSRFVLTRFWSSVALGYDTCGNGWLGQTVLGAQPVAKDEIWTVTTLASDGTKSTSYVLATTGEVIGHPASAPGATIDPALPLRADWSAYVERCIASEGHPFSVLEYVRWSNCEEYLHGISRHWLRRVGDEGAEGRIKHQIAERYILANVVGNR